MKTFKEFREGVEPVAEAPVDGVAKEHYLEMTICVQVK